MSPALWRALFCMWPPTDNFSLLWLLLLLLSSQILASKPVYLSAHRWGRAFVTQPLAVECLSSAGDRLALCGDWAAGVQASTMGTEAPTMESAWLSGEAAADGIAAMKP